MSGLATDLALDFTCRADLAELMDGPCSYEDFRDCLVDIARVNSYSLGSRPTLRWLQRFRSAGGRRLHIVDVGCGGGDMLRRIESWARTIHLPVSLLGVDINPYAERAARELTDVPSSIEWRTGDFRSVLANEPIDLVINSLFAHHLAERELVDFLAWAEATSRRGWFINDLSRSRTAYRLMSAMARLLPLHPFVVHDGPVSIRRAFSIDDWHSSLRRAAIDADQVNVFRCRPARLCVSRIK